MTRGTGEEWPEIASVDLCIERMFGNPGWMGGTYGEAAGCCCFVHIDGKEKKCPAPVAWAGHITMKYGFVPRAFACDEHRDVLDPPPRPYGHPEHIAEMNRRRARDEAARRSYEEATKGETNPRPWDG